MPRTAALALVPVLLACADSKNTESVGELHILSPATGQTLALNESVRLEVEGLDPEGAALALDEVTWAVHGTDWTAQGNGFDVGDLPSGWSLLTAVAEVQGTALKDAVEVVVSEDADLWGFGETDTHQDEESDTGDTGGSTSAGDTSSTTGIDHELLLSFYPSPVFEARGYTDCTASYSAVLETKLTGECPHADLTVEGDLSQDTGDCPGELLSSIPDHAIYGMDRGHAEGWDLWVVDDGVWVAAGVAEKDGNDFVLDITLGVTSGGVYAGEVVFTFAFFPQSA